MEFGKVIESRHSIRSFEKRKIPRAIIRKLIIAATKAPSASNRQPWTFYCVDGKKQRDEVAKLLKYMIGVVLRVDISKMNKKLKTVLNDFYEDLGGAQNIIFIYRTKEAKEAIYVKPNDIKSISCAAENLMLEAVNQGLGTCWIGTFNGKIPEKKLQKILKTNKNEELVAGIIVGYPKKGYIPLKRHKKSLNRIMKFI
ncbi:MAG: nitroreductase family protein [Candidatus Woesearchaeota archaeon]